LGQTDTMSYKIKTEVYEGPFDLLLDLILRKKLDIYEISLAQITADYLDYLQEMRALDLEMASEFLLVAATLLEIKVKGLLSEEEEEAEDADFPQTREDLAEKLLEFQKFKNAADFLEEKREIEARFFARQNVLEEKFATHPPDLLADFTVADLAETLTAILAKNSQSQPEYYLPAPSPLNVNKKMDFILKNLARASKNLSVLTKDCQNKGDIIATFLALLELHKQGKIFLKQPQAFGDIKVALREQLKH